MEDPTTASTVDATLGDQSAEVRGAPQPVVPDSQANPFVRIRVRRFFWWFLLAFLFMALFMSIAVLVGAWTDLLIGSVLYSIILLGVWRQLRRNQVAWGRVIGPLPSRDTCISALKILPLLVASGYAGFFLVGYPLSYLAPNYLDEFLNQEIIVTAADSRYQWVYNLIGIFEVVFLGPATEEILFRGVILHRWATKWTPAVAVWTSSLLFGALHLESFIGATLFGIVMAMLYLESGSLLVPVIVHWANNALACALEGLSRFDSSWSFWMTSSEVRSTPWLGVLLLMVSAPVMVRYIRGHWPLTSAPLPYFRLTAWSPSADGAPSVSPPQAN